MLRAGDELQLVDDPGRDTPLARSKHVATDDGDVDVAVANALLHDPRVRDAERDRDSRIRIAKARDERG